MRALNLENRSAAISPLCTSSYGGLARNSNLDSVPVLADDEYGVFSGPSKVVGLGWTTDCPRYSSITFSPPEKLFADRLYGSYVGKVFWASNSALVRDKVISAEDEHGTII